MLKYIGILALVFGLTVSVSIQDERAAKDAAQKAANQHKRALTCEPDEYHPQEHVQNPEQSSPSWYGFFRWPNGTTTWAIILTLFAIAEQTGQTAKAAKATQISAVNAEKQLAFQQEMLRPRLKVNEFVNDVLPEAVGAKWVIVNMKISNSGGLPAYGVIVDTWIEFVWGTPPYEFSTQANYARAEERLSVHTGSPTGFELPLGRKLNDKEKRAMGHAEGTICFRVKLTYQALGEEVYTDEAWSVGLGGMRSIAKYSSES